MKIRVTKVPQDGVHTTLIYADEEQTENSQRYMSTLMDAGGITTHTRGTMILQVQRLVRNEEVPSDAIAV